MKRILALSTTILLQIALCIAQNNPMRPLGELLEKQKKGWEEVTLWSTNSKNKIEILTKDDQRADSALYKAQLSASSPIGAIIYGCGGILVDDGWIRILGSGSKQFDRSLPDWNSGKSSVIFKDQSSYLLIADDIIGGIYGMKNYSVDNSEAGKIYYYGPNSLRWEATGLSYTGFINFCFSGNLQNFYGDFRWSGWRDDIKKLNGNQVISCYPLLWTMEGKELKTNRKIVPIQKQWEMYFPQKKSEAKQLPAAKNKPTIKKPKQSDKSLVSKRP